MYLTQGLHRALQQHPDRLATVDGRYLSETSMAELRRVIAAKRRALDTGNDYDQSRLVDHCA